MNKWFFSKMWSHRDAVRLCSLGPKVEGRMVRRSRVGRGCIRKGTAHFNSLCLSRSQEPMNVPNCKQQLNDVMHMYCKQVT